MALYSGDMFADSDCGSYTLLYLCSLHEIYTQNCRNVNSVPSSLIREVLMQPGLAMITDVYEFVLGLYKISPEI